MRRAAREYMRAYDYAYSPVPGFQLSCLALLRQSQDLFREKRLYNIAWGCVERGFSPLGSVHLSMAMPHYETVLDDRNLGYLMEAIFEGRSQALYKKMQQR